MKSFKGILETVVKYFVKFQKTKYDLVQGSLFSAIVVISCSVQFYFWSCRITESSLIF